jgi:hypothetical protein
MAYNMMRTIRKTFVAKKRHHAFKKRKSKPSQSLPGKTSKILRLSSDHPYLENKNLLLAPLRMTDF